MQLVIAIVRDDYSEILQDSLADAGHRYTKLASTGGFLRKGNTTLLVGVDDGQTESVLRIIRGCCRTRQELITPQPMPMSPGLAAPPIEVIAGGATVFVVDVAHFERI
ncbi:MAG: cyclic-di-AMP receptor [Clostridia bacterium]|nr:cyclic-di-AMP receptor [Clostridia bacterium]